MASFAQALIRGNALLSAAINTAISAVFFVAMFGWPARALALGEPDDLAFDFIPQAGMVGLMSALVPVLATRLRLGELSGQTPRAVGPIVVDALGLACASLLLGAGLAVMSLHGGVSSIGGPAAFAMKLVFGASLGATITVLALTRNVRALRAGAID